MIKLESVRFQSVLIQAAVGLVPVHSYLTHPEMHSANPCASINSALNSQHLTITATFHS